MSNIYLYRLKLRLELLKRFKRYQYQVYIFKHVYNQQLIMFSKEDNFQNSKATTLLQAEEVTHLISCQPNARNAVRLQALLPIKNQHKIGGDMLDKLQVLSYLNGQLLFTIFIVYLLFMRLRIRFCQFL